MKYDIISFTRAILTSVLVLVVASVNGQVSDWEVIYESDNVVLNKIDFWDHMNAIAVGDDGVIMRTTDGGQNWKFDRNPSMGDLTFIDVIRADTAYCTNGKQVYMTLDGGDSWATIFNSPEQVNGIYAERHWDDNIYLACDAGQIWASGSNGDQWFKVQSKGLIDEKDRVLYMFGGIIGSDPDTAYLVASRDGGYKISINEFRSWDSQVPFKFWKGDSRLKLVHEFYDYAERFFGINHFFVGMDNQITYLSGGTSISIDAQNATSDINGVVMQRYFDLGKKPEAWAVGEGGYIMKSEHFGRFDEMESPTDRDLNWIDHGVNFSEYHQLHAYDSLNFMIVGDGVILRKTYGWKFLPTHNNGLGGASQPKIELYPNPSSGFASIRVYGTQQKEGSVSLHDLNSRLVENIYQGALEEGHYLQVNGLTAGVYIVQVSGTMGKTTQKLVVY